MKLLKKAFEKLLGRGGREQWTVPSYIPNAALTTEMVPHRGAPMGEIVRFSLTFDGYWRKGSFNRCADVPVSREGTTLSEMRACLSHELKVFIRSGSALDSGTEAFIRNLLGRMRSAVERDERD